MCFEYKCLPRDQASHTTRCVGSRNLRNWSAYPETRQQNSFNSDLTMIEHRYLNEEYVGMQLVSSCDIKAGYISKEFSNNDFEKDSKQTANTRKLEENTYRGINYEKARVAAAQAIQSKPRGEERRPTAAWMGLGFSSSMPDAVLR